MDMKKILQAIDGIKATTAVPSSETKKVLPIAESTTAFKKYVQQVEQELTKDKNRKQERADQLAEAVKQRLDPKCWKGKHKEGTKIKGGVRVNNCVPNEGLEDPKDNPCWKGYKPVGTKKKAGKTVPNCVPTSEAANPAQQAAIAISKKKKAGVAEGTLGHVISWPEVVNKINSAMKATGWKGKRQGDDAFMFSTKGQLDDEFYIVIIENAGKGFFSYALGTVEDGDPYIDDAYKGKLPNTEASVSELINDIRDGFGLSEGVPRLSKHISQSKLPPDSLNRRAKNQAIKRLK